MSVEKKNSSCPSHKELELFYLTPNAATKIKKIQRHLLHCLRCKQEISRIKRFYQILSAELEKPIFPNVLDFCKQIAPKWTQYGLLICSPHPEKNNHHGKAYRATLAFSVNGTITQKKLTDYNLPAGHIGVMFYTDPKLNRLLLFLYSKDEQNFSRWRISIPGILQKTILNPSGAVNIESLNFELLINHLFYFQKASANSASKHAMKQIQATLSC